MKKKALQAVNLLEAMIPLLTLILLLGINVYIFGNDALGGPTQVALLLAAMVAVGIALYKGYTWETLEEGIIASINHAVPALLTLLMIGALSGTWLLSGIVPAMVYYGLKILHPNLLPVATCAICAIVSTVTGSSWSTIATIGIALLGIGKTLGWAENVIAGAIISGAYFGNKVSPLADTTLLATGITGTPLFTHIRYTLLTSIPALALTLVIFGIIGFTHDTTPACDHIAHISASIKTCFYVSPWLCLVPLLMIVLIIKKVAALPALLVGTLLGGLVAVLCQPQMILHVAGNTVLNGPSAYKAIMKAMAMAISTSTGDAMLDSLFASGGMAGMLATIWLILGAMTFGGVMEVTGMLTVLTNQLARMARSTGSLLASTTGTCIFFNLVCSDQALAILIPGKMYAALYQQANLKPQNLSRNLADAATVTAPLVPWNSCGATQSTVLGVATLAYLPYCFFNLLSPVMGILVGYLTIRIAKRNPDDTPCADEDAKQPTLGAE